MTFSSNVKPQALGRGLAELLGDVSNNLPNNDQVVDNDTTKIIYLQPQYLHANQNQPRKYFAPAELNELSQSLKEHGMLQSIIARSSGSHDGKYEIIAGERRWRAAKLANIDAVPVLVYNIDDRKAFEIALIENIQRADLNVMEEVEGYNTLLHDHGYTQEKLSQLVGKSRSHIANLVRLTELPKEVQKLVRENKLGFSHARMLVGANNAIKLANSVIKRNLTVRQLEKIIADNAQKERNNSLPNQDKTSRMNATELADLEKSISKILNLDVQIKGMQQGFNKGYVKISFSAFHELQRLLDRFAHGE